MMMFIIRQIELRDELPLLALRNKSNFNKWYRNPNKVLASEHQIWFMDRLENWRSITLVAELINFEIIGICYLTQVNESRYEISIAVHDKYQKLGIGRKLVSLLTKEAKTKEIKSIFASINKNNQTSIDFFQSMKFISTEILKLNNSEFISFELELSKI